MVHSSLTHTHTPAQSLTESIAAGGAELLTLVICRADVPSESRLNIKSDIFLLVFFLLDLIWKQIPDQIPDQIQRRLMLPL